MTGEVQGEEWRRENWDGSIAERSGSEWMSERVCVSSVKGSLCAECTMKHEHHSVSYAAFVCALCFVWTLLRTKVVQYE